MPLKKVCVPVLNRATFGRLKSVLKAVHEHPDLELQVVPGASLFDAKLDFPVACRAQCMIEGDNLATMPLTASMWIAQFTTIVENLNPDIIYIHGDRYESLGTALVGAYLNKIVAHGEGGDVSGSIDEKIRHSVTKLADIHFPVTELSKQRIIQMGESPERIHVVGSTALDTIKDIDLSNKRQRPYVLILMHPNTKEHEPIEPVFEAVDKLDCDKIVINPNVDPGNKSILKRIHQRNYEFVKNIPPEEYARLIYNAKCLVGNSSSFIKEAAFLGVPAVLVGVRQSGREVGQNIITVKNDTRKILLAISLHATQTFLNKRYQPDYRFGDGTAATKICKILAEVSL